MENSIQLNDLIINVDDVEVPEQELNKQIDFYKDLYQRFEVVREENKEIKDLLIEVYFIQSVNNLDFPFYIIISEEGGCVAFLRSTTEEPSVKSDCICEAVDKLKEFFKAKEPYRVYRVDSEWNVFVPTLFEPFLRTSL